MKPKLPTTNIKHDNCSHYNKPKLIKCQECGRVIEPGQDRLGNETEGWALINTKRVCQLCFVRLKQYSKCHHRPLTNKVWERWIKLSEDNK